MQIWRFYLDRRKIKFNKRLDLDDKDMKEKYVLYAITNNKKYAKEFMRLRNMKIFRMITSDVTSEEWASYANAYTTKKMTKFYLLTRGDHEDYVINDGESCHRDVSIVGPEEENMLMESYIEDGEYIEQLFEGILKGNAKAMNPYLFTEEYIKILRDIGYVSMYKIMIGIDDPAFHIREEDDDYSCSLIGDNRSYAVDELSVYIDMFGHTYI